MAVRSLSKHFTSFFSCLNPGTTFEQTAASQHLTIRSLIENSSGPAAELYPVTFLQGSYRQQTAIHTINDVDIVVLCNLSFPGVPGLGGGKQYGRDEIFRIIASPLLADGRYRDKVRYSSTSMCIKVDLSIKVEILPVVFKRGTTDSSHEPFILYRPHKGIWEDGFARHHQWWLTNKNGLLTTSGNFIPAIKVFKHIRSIFGKNAVSFHIECLLFRLDDSNFTGGTADWLAKLFRAISSVSAADWYRTRLMTPCGDRDIFTAEEWGWDDWSAFHTLIAQCSVVATTAVTTNNEAEAIECWQAILGSGYFPATVS